MGGMARVSVVVKLKDPRPNCKPVVAEFVLAFRIFRDVVCSATPGRREELDSYPKSVTARRYKYTRIY